MLPLKATKFLYDEGKAAFIERMPCVRILFSAGQEVHLAMGKGMKRQKSARPEPTRTKTRKQNPHETADRVAIGLNFVQCGIPLYVTPTDEKKVLASLHATGLVGLHCCMCGSWQFVGSASFKRND